MIKKKTVFVLGAGASIPYGLPSGFELREAICALLEPARLQNAVTIAGQHGHERTALENFLTAFLRSNVLSIDSFLSRRSDYAEIGKLMIAAEICGRERPDRIINPTTDDNWYQALWNALISDVSSEYELDQNKVRFISFNYDRSLEYFLYESTKHTFGLPDDEVSARLKRLQIIHVYGVAGAFCISPTNSARIYTNKYSPESLGLAATSIRILPEARDNDPLFNEARDLFNWAETICFLGFGFDPLNVRRLDLGSVLSYKKDRPENLPRIVASAFRKTQAETTEIARLVTEEQSSMTFGHSAWKNLDVLREFGILLG